MSKAFCSAVAPAQSGARPPALLVEKNTVTVVSKSGSTESTVQLSRSFVRVELPSESKDLIVISQGKKHAYFGSHVHANLREALGREIVLKV